MTAKSGRPEVRRRQARLRRHRLAAILVAAVLVAALVPVWSFTRAVTAPGTDSVAVKAAEWARGHRLGFLVTAAEEVSYRLHPPRSGGTPDPSLLRLPPEPRVNGRPRTFPWSGLLSPIGSLAGRPLSGEGVFRALVHRHGRVAVQLAYLRPDPVHTSYLAAVLVLDRSLRFVLHPGYADPAHLGLWSQPDSIPPGARAGLAATFNGGFKLQDARGGYYADGHTLGTLQPGAASVVITRDGHLMVGQWGRDVSMSPQVVAVRQNLRPLIEAGQLSPTLEGNVHSTWGATIAGADYVWRSGLGVTAHGQVVYALGAALSARTLARVLQRAGAVRAMQLDINPTWVSGMWYSPQPHKILPFRRPADRYFSSTSRDFVAAYVR